MTGIKLPRMADQGRSRIDTALNEQQAEAPANAAPPQRAPGRKKSGAVPPPPPRMNRAEQPPPRTLTLPTTATIQVAR